MIELATEVRRHQGNYLHWLWVGHILFHHEHDVIWAFLKHLGEIFHCNLIFFVPRVPVLRIQRQSKITTSHKFEIH